MEVQLYYGTPTLDNLPPEIRLMVYDELVHDPHPIYTRPDRRFSRLQGLMSLRQASNTFHADLTFTRMSKLNIAFYEDNNFLFKSARDLADFAETKSQGILDSIRSITVDEHWPDTRFWARRQRVVVAVQTLPSFRHLDRIRLCVGTLDWSQGDCDFDGWLEQPGAVSRDPCWVLFKYFLCSTAMPISISNRPILEMVLRPCASDYTSSRSTFAYTGVHTNVKLEYQETVANGHDWRQISAPVELAAEQAEQRL